MSPAPAAPGRARRHRIAVVHSQLLVGEVVAAALGRTPGLSCVDVTHDLRRVQPSLPTLAVLVLDQRCLQEAAAVLGGNGLPALVALGDEDASDRTGDCLRALRLGARAWVTAQAAEGALVGAVLAAARGELWFPLEAGPRVVERLLDAERQALRLNVLTAKEHEVLRHLVAGHSAARTAELMVVSTNTVRSHRSRLFAKLGVHAGHEAAALAREAGMTT